MTDRSYEYTEIFENFKSSFIEGIYFNENDGTVALDLKNEIYVYKGVTREDVVKLVSAPSVGAAYSAFKDMYGPAELIGSWSFDLFKEVEVEPKTIKWTDGSLSSSGSDILTSSSISISTGGWIAVPHKNHEITFTIDGLDEERTYSTLAKDVDGAVKVLDNVLEPLGIKFKVKRVVTYF